MVDLSSYGVLLSLQKGVDFAFSNYYASSMVLQRSPARAVVWGYGFNTGDAVTVTINVGGQDLVYETTTVDGEFSYIRLSI